MPYKGKNRLKPVPVEEFGEHVQRMHADRDKFFELEYNVRAQYINFATSHSVVLFSVIIGYREITSVRP